MPYGEHPSPATIITLWMFSTLAFLTLLGRLYWRFRLGDRFLKDDIWMGLSIIPLILRLCFIHLSTIFLTASFDHRLNPESSMSASEVARRTLGAQMVLPGRVMYAGFLWAMKLCILHWFEKVTGRTGAYARVLDAAYWGLWVTFGAVVASTFLECRPIARYWQIWPNPGSCVKATVQLVTMGVLNIFTDLVLIAIPLPLVFRARMPLMRKLQLALLFGVSFFVIAITVVRMPIIIGHNSLQATRSLWASIEVFVAALVANAPMFNSLLHTHRPTASPPSSGDTPPPPATARRAVAMPVTGQDSNGSLTRNDGDVTVVVVADSTDSKNMGPYRPLRTLSGEKDAWSVGRGGDGGGGGVGGMMVSGQQTVSWAHHDHGWAGGGGDEEDLR